MLSIFNPLNQKADSEGHTSGSFSSYYFTAYKHVSKNFCEKCKSETNIIFCFNNPTALGKRLWNLSLKLNIEILNNMLPYSSIATVLTDDQWQPLDSLLTGSNL